MNSLFTYKNSHLQNARDAMEMFLDIMSPKAHEVPGTVHSKGPVSSFHCLDGTEVLNTRVCCFSRQLRLRASMCEEITKSKYNSNTAAQQFNKT